MNDEQNISIEAQSAYDARQTGLTGGNRFGVLLAVGFMLGIVPMVLGAMVAVGVISYRFVIAYSGF